MRLVITDHLFETIAKQLLNCTLDLICSGGVELVTKIVLTSCQLSEDAQNKKRSWGIFKQGVVEGSCYLKNFESPKQFYGYVDSNVHTVDEAWNLALELDSIKGIGPPLACDFLKEVGVNCYGKPDIHIKRAFNKLKLIGDNDQDKKTFEVLWRIAELSCYSTAMVDKIFWMAASDRWDRTLDKGLASAIQKGQQLHRKQHFSTLLNQFIRGR